MQPLPILKYTSRKLLKLLSLLVAVATFSFVMLALSPIDPVDAYIGADMMLVSPEQRELIAERWGLNEPPVERFLAWGGQVLQGNLGTSLIYNRFVGIGLAPHTPAIGIILSEAMRHLSTGYWWLAVLPGLALLVSVKLFDILGENLRDLLNPKTSQG